MNSRKTGCGAIEGGSTKSWNNYGFLNCSYAINIYFRDTCMNPATKEHFEEDQNRLAEMAKALGHPARIAILNYLIENNGQTCKSIVEKLPFSQSTVSQHLSELKTSGWITGKSYKTSMIYSIDVDVLQDFQTLYRKTFGLSAEKKQLSLF